eukprot:1260746-Amphidinium_carterae.1
MGITSHPKTCGISLHGPDDAGPEVDYATLISADGWQEDLDLDKADIAAQELAKYESLGFVKSLASGRELQDYIGGNQSFTCAITSASSNVERVQLPRVWDVLRDFMTLWKDHSAAGVSFLVLDFENAFWQIPVLRSEW